MNPADLPLLHPDDTRSDAAQKLRLLTENFCLRHDIAVLPDPCRRVGKSRHQWQPIFEDAIRRYNVLRSYRGSLGEAVAAFLMESSASEADKFHLRHVDSESLLRMFRDWRTGLVRGVPEITKFDRESFWSAVSAGDPRTSATVFVSLSHATRKKICAEYEGLRDILVTMSNKHASNNPLLSQ